MHSHGVQTRKNTIEGAQRSACSLRAEQHWPQTVVDSSGRMNGWGVATDALCSSLTCCELPEALLGSKSPYSKIIGSPLSLLRSLQKKCRDPSCTGDPGHRPQTAKVLCDQHRNLTLSRNEPNCLLILNSFIVRLAYLTRQLEIPLFSSSRCFSFRLEASVTTILGRPSSHRLSLKSTLTRGILFLFVADSLTRLSTASSLCSI